VRALDIGEPKTRGNNVTGTLITRSMSIGTITDEATATAVISWRIRKSWSCFYKLC
ncbi:unnamed protein product, partial [Choristocarpus tenellus]